MIAEGVRETDLAAYQRAARTLLVHPLVTGVHPDADALALVRRFAPVLTRDLDAVAGYRLEVGPTCARLVTRVDRLDVTQAIQPSGKKPFDRRRYAYLSLVLGAIGRAGSQIALTELADALRRRAHDVDGLGFDPDEYRHRLAFVDVVLHLESLGVLRPLEVSNVAWLKDPDAGDALYDVDRDAAHELFVPPRVIQHVTSAAALLAGDLTASRDTRRAASRQRLARLLLEHPVVYLDDLSSADRAYLVHQARPLGDDLARLTGAQLERRAEGVALVDATGGFSDRRFPTGGTPSQVALLLADAISAAVAGDGDRVTVPTATARARELVDALDRARPLVGGPPDVADVPVAFDIASGATDSDDDDDPDDDGEPPTGPFLSDGWLAAGIERLLASHGTTFAADLRNDPVALRRAAVDVLVAFDLVRPVPGGIVVRPAIARYRDVAVERVHTAPPPQLSLLEVTT